MAGGWGMIRARVWMTMGVIKLSDNVFFSPLHVTIPRPSEEIMNTRLRLASTIHSLERVNNVYFQTHIPDRRLDHINALAQ